MNEILGPLLLVVLIPLAAIIGKLLAGLIKKGISKIDNEALQSFTWMAVRFAEQKFKKLHGQDKFDVVYERIAKNFPGVEKENIEAAIEATVNAMNKELGNAASSPTE